MLSTTCHPQDNPRVVSTTCTLCYPQYIKCVPQPKNSARIRTLYMCCGHIGYPVRVSIPALCCGERLLYCGCMLWRHGLWVHAHCVDRTHIVGICCGQNPLMAHPVGDDMLWVTFFLCCPQHMLVFSTACTCCGAYPAEKSSFTDVFTMVTRLFGGAVVVMNVSSSNRELGQLLSAQT